MSLIATVKCDSCKKVHIDDFEYNLNDIHGLHSDLDEGGWNMPNGEHWCSQCRWELEISKDQKCPICTLKMSTHNGVKCK